MDQSVIQGGTVLVLPFKKRRVLLQGVWSSCGTPGIQGSIWAEVMLSGKALSQFLSTGDGMHWSHFSPAWNSWSRQSLLWSSWLGWTRLSQICVVVQWPRCPVQLSSLLSLAGVTHQQTSVLSHHLSCCSLENLSRHKQYSVWTSCPSERHSQLSHAVYRDEMCFPAQHLALLAARTERFCFVLYVLTVNSTPCLGHLSGPNFASYISRVPSVLFWRNLSRDFCPALIWSDHPFCLVHSLDHSQVTSYLSPREDFLFSRSVISSFLFFFFPPFYFGFPPFPRKSMQEVHLLRLFMSENVYNLPCYLVSSLAEYEIEGWK